MYAFFADLHVGENLSRESYLKSLNDFLGYIKAEKEECHCIFACGDFFTKKLNIDDLVFAGSLILNLVLNNCGKTKQHVPVHFIHGTYTHDNDQYDVFMNFLQKLPNAEVFYTNKACIGTLKNGKRVLYLPQEYGAVDYSIMTKEKFDIIVGHGPIASETYGPCQATQFENLFSVELLGKISQICVFGHYHGYTDFGNGVYYTGPWLRWQYGEDEPRVFFFCDDEFKVFTKPNENALNFDTFKIYDPEQLRVHLSNKLTNPKRFEINCKPDQLSEYHAIMNQHKHPWIKFKMILDKDEPTQTKEIKQIKVSSAIEPIPALIQYIQDKNNIDASEMIHQYETKIKNEGE